MTATTESKQIMDEAKDKALKKLEVKREIKKDIDEKIEKKLELGADQDEIEACIIMNDA